MAPSMSRHNDVSNAVSMCGACARARVGLIWRECLCHLRKVSSRIISQSRMAVSPRRRTTDRSGGLLETVQHGGEAVAHHLRYWRDLIAGAFDAPVDGQRSDAMDVGPYRQAVRFQHPRTDEARLLQALQHAGERTERPFAGFV